MVTSSVDVYPSADASCLVCGGRAVTPPDETPTMDAASQLSAPPTRLPTPELCREHWADFRTDWLLLGWCVDHYGQALTPCPVHHREIEPL